MPLVAYFAEGQFGGGDALPGLMPLDAYFAEGQFGGGDALPGLMPLVAYFGSARFAGAEVPLPALMPLDAYFGRAQFSGADAGSSSADVWGWIRLSICKQRHHRQQTFLRPAFGWPSAGRPT
jgi:uncharacterized membrane protein